MCRGDPVTSEILQSSYHTSPFFLPSLLLAPFFLLSHVSSSSIPVLTSHSFFLPHLPLLFLFLPLFFLPSLLFLSSFSAHLPDSLTSQILRGFHLHLHEVPSLSLVFFANILFYSLSANHSDIFSIIKHSKLTPYMKFLKSISSA